MFDVATRLQKYFPYVRHTLLKFEFGFARNVLLLFDTVTISPDANDFLRADVLDTIAVVFKGFRHVQIALKAGDHITIIKIIAMLEYIEASLRLVLFGVMNSVTMIFPGLPVPELAIVKLRAIDKLSTPLFGRRLYSYIRVCTAVHFYHRMLVMT